jgi:SAM-dependent methyltransferase
MLDICRQKLAGERVEVQARVQIVHGDIRRFDLGRTFRLVTIPFRPFQHLIELEDQLACLACVRTHLDTGGRFVLDVFNPDIRRLVDASFNEEPPFQTPDGRHVARKYRKASVDLHAQVLNAEIVYDVTHPDGRKEQLVDPFPFRYYFRYELEHYWQGRVLK